MLDARQLDALVAVIEHGSFSAAAKTLSISLAAVSLRIKSLEAALGQRLLVRGKRVAATPTGQALLTHVRQVRLLEADVLAGMQGRVAGRAQRLQRLSVAVNADSLTTWFLPGVAATCARHHILLDIVVDDQDHTEDALRSGDVTGCVTTLAQTMRGCVAEPLGLMRYRCMAAPAQVEKWRGGKSQAGGSTIDATGGPTSGTVHAQRLLASPAVIFNRKDALQDAFLAQHFQLRDAQYPRHFVPAVEAFDMALELGMGWGMVPELSLAARSHRPPLAEVLPGKTVDVALYWQHWASESQLAQRLTRAVKAAASARLIQPD